MTVGTLEWARRTNGRLSRRDQVALLLQGMRRMLPRRSRLGAALDLDGYVPPDSAAAREAEEACRSASEPFLEAHCHRVNLWGVAIGRAEALEFDEEALYVASLTHDLGLTDRHRGAWPGSECFSLDSAAAARAVMDSDTVAEAITLHLNAHVPLACGPEAYLLGLGASLDVTGHRLRDVDADTRAAVLARHSRQQMKRNFKAAMDDELVRHPCSRPAFFTKRAGFKLMIERAPFDE